MIAPRHLPGLIDWDDDDYSDDGDEDSVKDPNYDPAKPEELGVEDPDKLMDLLRQTEHPCDRLVECSCHRVCKSCITKTVWGHCVANELGWIHIRQISPCFNYFVLICSP